MVLLFRVRLDCPKNHNVVNMSSTANNFECFQYADDDEALTAV